MSRNGHVHQLIEMKIRNKRFYLYSKVEKVISDKERQLLFEFETADSKYFVIKIIKGLD